MSDFAQFALASTLLDAITALGFETPTPVQSAVIPVLLEGDRNLIALAQTGTGKTAAFGLPLLHKVDLKQKHVQAVVLCPTRELCLQVCRDLRSFGKYLPGLQVAAVYGGASISGQIRSLKMGSHVLVATPGRLHDLLRREAADLSGSACVVLDEADEMLGMGFEEDLKAIMAAISPGVQKLLFSATMPKSLAALVHAFVSNPLEIAIGTRGSGAETVEHHVYIVREQDRYQALRRILDEVPGMYGLVFCRTRMETQEVSEALVRDGYRADALHGDLSQVQRDRVMQAFSNRQIQILVATNVAARGLDISELDHVISFRLPDELEGYTHRSGRTGRAGRKGTSSALITPRERFKIPHIERSLGCRFLLQSVPDGRTVCAARISAWLERMRGDENGLERIAPFVSGIMAQLERVPQDELVARLLSAQFADLLDHYRMAPDLNADMKVPARGGGRRPAEDGGRNGRDRGGRVSSSRVPSRGPGHGGAPRAPRREARPARPASAPVPSQKHYGTRDAVPSKAAAAPQAPAPERMPRPPKAKKPFRERGAASGAPPKGKGKPAGKGTPAPARKDKKSDGTPDWVRQMMQGGKKKGGKKKPGNG